MTMRRISVLTGSLLLALVLVAGTNCSKKATNPGGGGGSTLELNSGTIAPTAQYVHIFAMAGTFTYHCTFHGGMTGSVTVASGGAASASIAIGDNFFNPSSVTVAPGATVTWTNGGGTNHSVTSP